MEEYGLEALVRGFEKAGVKFNQEILDDYQQERTTSDKQEIESLIASLEAGFKDSEIDRMLDERNKAGFNRLAR